VLHAERLGDCYLDAVDVISVPDRLEDGVCEPEDEYVLNGFFSEIVVDSVDL